MNFLKVVIYQNVKKKKKKKKNSKQTYLYLRVTDILKFYEVLFFTYCVGLFCLQETVIMLIFLCICIKHSQH